MFKLYDSSSCIGKYLPTAKQMKAMQMRKRKHQHFLDNIYHSSCRSNSPFCSALIAEMQTSL